MVAGEMKGDRGGKDSERIELIFPEVGKSARARARVCVCVCVCVCDVMHFF